MVEAFGKASTSKWANVTVRSGDRIRLITPGGGGYGDVKRRARDAVREDVAEGYVTAEAARQIYGLESERGD